MLGNCYNCKHSLFKENASICYCRLHEKEMDEPLDSCKEWETMVTYDASRSDC